MRDRELAAEGVNSCCRQIGFMVGIYSVSYCLVAGIGLCDEIVDVVSTPSRHLGGCGSFQLETFQVSIIKFPGFVMLFPAG